MTAKKTKAKASAPVRPSAAKKKATPKQAAKPAPKIFHLAVEKHAVDPADGVHVGDSLEEDVEGATKAGLTSVLIDRSEAEVVPGIHRIRSLDQLQSLLARL